MDENILKLRVGIFVLIAMTILGILISLNSEGFVSQYTVYVEPTNAPGVSVGTPIRKNGVLIGRVKAVTPKDDHVVLRLGINDDIRVFENEVCEIGSNSILGDSVVEFITVPRDDRGEPLLDGAEVRTFALKQSPADVMKSVTNMGPILEKTLLTVQVATNNVGDAAAQVGDLAQTIKIELQDERSDFKQLMGEIRQLAQKSDVAFDNFNRIFENINDVIGDPRLKSQILDAALELPQILQELRATIADAGDTVRGFQTIPENINQITENVMPFTQSLGEQGPEIIANVQSAVSNVDELTREAHQLTDMLREFNESDGSIKRILNDDGELYKSVQASLQNIKELTIKLGPIARDFRLFSDQLARKPSSIISGVGSKAGRYKATPGQNREKIYNY